MCIYEVSISSLELGEQTRTLGPMERLKIEDFFEEIAAAPFMDRAYNVRIFSEGRAIKIVDHVPQES